MAANSASGGKRAVCGRLSHRYSRLSRCYQPNNRLNPAFQWKARRLSQKGRDVASFGGVLEALTGQTFRICTFIVRCAFCGCVSGALIRP
jgi:hypothetical protein